MTEAKKLVIANWKMNPGAIGDAKKLFLDTRTASSRLAHVETVVAPPFPFLAELRKLSSGKRTLLGAQNVHFEKSGAYTGEVSAPMLLSLGVSHVIVGHSERREMGETDESVNKKIHALTKAGLTAVVCVGERERDAAGAYLGFVEEELIAAFQGVTKKQLKNVVIAYEPIWAIGTGNTATPEDAYEMRIFIQKIMTDRYDRKAAMNVPVLYGGSVKAANAESLLSDGECDGFLVGGASLKAKEFGVILKAAQKHGA